MAFPGDRGVGGKAQIRALRLTSVKSRQDEEKLSKRNEGIQEQKCPQPSGVLRRGRGQRRSMRHRHNVDDYDREEATGLEVVSHLGK